MGKNVRMKYKKRRMPFQRSDAFKAGTRNSNFFRSAKNMPQLKPQDWSGVVLNEVKKNLYQEHAKVKARDEALIAEYMDQNRISVKGHDCPRPVEAFDEFCFPDCIMDAIKAQNFVKPTPIQAQAIPVALSGKNMVGIADTGSGKTLAYILPAIAHILGNNHPRNIGEPEVVILAPTRELAQQIHQVVVSLGPGINVKSECFFGGSKRVDQAILTEKVFEICIATPGRMVDFLSTGYVRLHHCAFFVLDEADRMLDMGFSPQIKQVIGQSRPDRQMLMFSATWPPEIQELAESYLKDYIRVNIGSLQISANHNITQKVLFCESDDKAQRIVKIMKEVMQEEENKTLIFVNSKLDVDLLTLQFRLNGWGAMGTHGSKKQVERDQVFNDFKTGKISILIATDLAARGLDVDDIKYIVNYDYPFCSEDYVHRIGRTGRCNRKGTAITLFAQKDRDKAKDLITVLEEAGQSVPPHLRNMACLPPPNKKEKLSKVPGSKIKRKLVKKFLRQRHINSIPLGSETGGDRLPGVEEIIGSTLNELVASSAAEKNKRKSGNKVEALETWPSSDKKSKTGIHSNTSPSNRFTDDQYSDDFENPQWAPSGNPQQYEENSRIAPNYSNVNQSAAHGVNMQNPDFNMKSRELGHNFEIPFNNTRVSADVKRGDNAYSTDYRNTGMPMNSRNYETSMGSRGSGLSENAGKYEDSYGRRENNVYSTDYRNASMPMGPIGSGSSVNASKHQDSYGRREDNVYSTDYRNTSNPMNSRNYKTPMGPSVNAGKHEDSYSRRENNVYSTDYRNASMPMNSRNYETSMGPRSSGPFGNARGMEPSFSARNQAGVSSDRRQNDPGWNGAPAWQNPTYNNYTSHQTSNWGPPRNNCSINRMDINHYPAQNWSGRSGYNQY